MKKNIKTIVGLIIAFIIGISTTVGAATVFNSKDITYSSSATSKTNVKDSLDELYTKVNTPWSCASGWYCYKNACPDGKICLDDNFINKVKIGDYISMTPTSTSYTISKSLTGYTSDQTINPSELNLWRVIKKNDDGTVDIVSDGISSKNVCFKGATGLKSFDETLQEISKQYINSSLISDSRYPGYVQNGRTCSSASNCSSGLDWYKDLGLLGDMVMIPGATNSVGHTKTYWLGARKWESSTSYGGWAFNSGLKTVVWVDFRSSEECGAMRIILTLRNTVYVKSGTGTVAAPYILG